MMDDATKFYMNAVREMLHDKEFEMRHPHAVISLARAMTVEDAGVRILAHEAAEYTSHYIWKNGEIPEIFNSAPIFPRMRFLYDLHRPVSDVPLRVRTDMTSWEIEEGDEEYPPFLWGQEAGKTWVLYAEAVSETEGVIGGVLCYCAERFPNPLNTYNYILPGVWALAQAASGRVYSLNEQKWQVSEMSYEQLYENLVKQIIYPAFFALNLAHCRNVDLVESHLPRPERRRRERQGLPYITQRVLRIKANDRRYVSGEHGRPKYDLRWHQRRGGFAHFPNGLFNKPELAGIYWRPATTVGNPRKGRVEKAYEIEAEGQEGIIAGS